MWFLSVSLPLSCLEFVESVPAVDEWRQPLSNPLSPHPLLLHSLFWWSNNTFSFSLLCHLWVFLIIWCLSCLVYLIGPYYQICCYFLHLTLISFNLLLRRLLFDNLALSSCLKILPLLSRHIKLIYSAEKFCDSNSNSFQHLATIPWILKLCRLIKSCLFSEFRDNLCFLQLGSWGQHWHLAYVQYTHFNTNRIRELSQRSRSPHTTKWMSKTRLKRQLREAWCGHSPVPLPADAFKKPVHNSFKRGLLGLQTFCPIPSNAQILCVHFWYPSTDLHRTFACVTEYSSRVYSLGDGSLYLT